MNANFALMILWIIGPVGPLLYAIDSTKNPSNKPNSCNLEPLSFTETSVANKPSKRAQFEGWVFNWIGTDDPDFILQIVRPHKKPCDYKGSLIEKAYFSEGKLLLLEGYSGSNKMIYFVNPLTCREKQPPIELATVQVVISGNEMGIAGACEPNRQSGVTCQQSKIYKFNEKCEVSQK